MGERTVFDRVIATQPELGPSIPDGGYGWVVVVGSAFFQGLIPSLTTAYGIFLLHLKLEHSSFSYPMLWDETMVHTPLLFAATWTIVEPWTRRLISNSTWPRLVGVAGTCLTCAGLLFMWMAINNTSGKMTLYVLAGIISGIGASICCSQTEILLAQYFRLKLSNVNSLLEAIVAFSFMATPIILGDNIIKHGILRVLVTYQTVILQGVIICAVFKKPNYLKSKRRTYKYISGTADDEEEIYTKDVRELQSRKAQENSNAETSTTEVGIEPLPTSHNINNNAVEENRKKWVKFNEETTSAKSSLHESFAEDFNNDLDRIDKFESDFVPIPQPLFNDAQVNNNTTYSYEPVVTNNEMQGPAVFTVPPTVSRKNSIMQNINYLKQPKFYMALLTIITTKFSQFIFFTLFPSYLYVRVDTLKIHHATMLVGSLAIIGLCFTAFSAYINAHSTNRRPVLLWLLCWFGSCGYIMLSNTNSEYFLLVGAATVILSINALQNVGEPLLSLTIRGETNERHRNLSILSGCAFGIFLIVDFSYANCFRLMAICQLTTGAVWLINFIYEKWQE